MIKDYPKIEILWNLKEDPFLTFIVGVHWDEQAPIKALDIFKKNIENQTLRKNIKIIYANPKAISNNLRFIEQDLNNSFFGKYKWTYEEDLANILKEELKKTKYNFDFHTTSFKINWPYWVISIYNYTVNDIISNLWITNNVFTDKECLIKCCPNGIWFEVWYEKDPNTILNALKIMEDILVYFDIIPIKNNYIKEDINIFLIYRLINKSEFIKINNGIIDFKKVNKWESIWIKTDWKEVLAEEVFYPIWVEDETFIRMAKKIKIEE